MRIFFVAYYRGRSGGGSGVGVLVFGQELRHTLVRHQDASGGSTRFFHLGVHPKDHVDIGGGSG